MFSIWHVNINITDYKTLQIKTQIKPFKIHFYHILFSYSKTKITEHTKLTHFIHYRNTPILVFNLLLYYIYIYNTLIMVNNITHNINIKILQALTYNTKNPFKHITGLFYAQIILHGLCIIVLTSWTIYCNFCHSFLSIFTFLTNYLIQTKRLRFMNFTLRDVCLVFLEHKMHLFKQLIYYILCYKNELFTNILLIYLYNEKYCFKTHTFSDIMLNDTLHHNFTLTLLLSNIDYGNFTALIKIYMLQKYTYAEMDFNLISLIYSYGLSFCFGGYPDLDVLILIFLFQWWIVI